MRLKNLEGFLQNQKITIKKCFYGLYLYFCTNLYRRNRSYHDWGQHVVRMLLFFQLNDMKSDKMSDE